MADHYGELIGQGLPDPPWIDEQSASGLVLLTKDQGFRRRTGPVRESVERAGARVFLLANASLGSADQIACYLNNRETIMSRARNPGPYIQVVQRETVVRYWHQG